MNSRLGFVLYCFLAFLAAPTFAALPQTIHYQGYLTNPVGAPVNSAVVMTFRLYNAASGGSALFTETQLSVNVTSGTFNAVIGAVTPLTLAFDVPYWLTVAINADPEMMPRQPLAASPYAFRAASLDSAATIAGSQVVGPVTIASGSVGTLQLADGAVTAAKMASNGCSAGQVLKFNGASWACAPAACVAGDLLPCYSGPAATLGVGVCKSGFRSCDTMSGTFGTCIGQVLPSTDVADGLDNDCDGGVDNAPGTAALIVTKSGTGSGSVSSNPAGINCGADCNEGYAAGLPVTLTATPVAGSTFTGWSGGSCSGTGTCMLTMSSARTVNAAFVLNTFMLTVTVNGGGTVSSADGKISACTSGGGTCTGIYNSGDQATLTATTVNGSNAYFSDWTSTSCEGPARTCIETMTSTRNAAANFGSFTTSGNLMFVTSTATYNGASSTSEAFYDSECNDRASVAGINNAAGNLYMAWISTATSNARTRLTPSYRGWVRLDGAILADDQVSLFNSASPKFMNSVRYDENGTTVSLASLLTGTNADGTTAANCTGWSTTGGSFLAGVSSGGAASWTAHTTSACTTASRLLCVMKRNNFAISPPPAPAGSKRIVVTNSTYAPNGTQTPTQRCVADAGAGYVALIGSIGNQVGTLLVPGTTYVRPDNVVIGTGAQLAAASFANPAPSGIFQRANGNYMETTASFGNTYVGPFSLTTAGTVTNTCNNWTDPATPSPATYVGNPTQTTNFLFSNGFGNNCSVVRPLYCIQQ